MKRIISVILVVVLALTLGFGCTKNDVNKANVSIRMKWFFAGTMSHFFYGKELGLFEKNGINLTIQPGGPDNNAIKLVAAGTDNIGVTGADEALIAIQKGIPIKIIGTVFYKSPIVFISKKNRGLDKFEGVKGHSVEIDYGSNAEVQFRAFAEAKGIKKGQYKEQPYTYNLIPFLQNKVDYSVAYEMDQVNTLKNKGVAINVFYPEDAGISLMGDVLICRTDYFENNKNTIDKFLASLRTAIAESVAQPDEAAAALVKASPGVDPVNEKQIFKETIKYLTYDKNILKNIPDLWLKTFNFLQSQKLLDEKQMAKWKENIYW